MKQFLKLSGICFTTVLYAFIIVVICSFFCLFILFQSWSLNWSWISGWLLFNVKWIFFQLYKLHFNVMMMSGLLRRIFIELVHCNNSLWVYMSLLLSHYPDSVYMSLPLPIILIRYTCHFFYPIILIRYTCHLLYPIILIWYTCHFLYPIFLIRANQLLFFLYYGVCLVEKQYMPIV